MRFHVFKNIKCIQLTRKLLQVLAEEECASLKIIYDVIISENTIERKTIEIKESNYKESKKCFIIDRLPTEKPFLFRWSIHFFNKPGFSTIWMKASPQKNKIYKIRAIPWASPHYSKVVKSTSASNQYTLTIGLTLPCPLTKNVEIRWHTPKCPKGTLLSPGFEQNNTFYSTCHEQKNRIWLTKLVDRRDAGIHSITIDRQIQFTKFTWCPTQQHAEFTQDFNHSHKFFTAHVPKGGIVHINYGRKGEGQYICYLSNQNNAKYLGKGLCGHNTILNHKGIAKQTGFFILHNQKTYGPQYDTKHYHHPSK